MGCNPHGAKYFVYWGQIQMISHKLQVELRISIMCGCNKELLHDIFTPFWVRFLLWLCYNYPTLSTKFNMCQQLDVNLCNSTGKIYGVWHGSLRICWTTWAPRMYNQIWLPTHSSNFEYYCETILNQWKDQVWWFCFCLYPLNGEFNYAMYTSYIIDMHG